MNSWKNEVLQSTFRKNCNLSYTRNWKCSARCKEDLHKMHHFLFVSFIITMSSVWDIIFLVLEIYQEETQQNPAIIYSHRQRTCSEHNNTAGIPSPHWLGHNIRLWKQIWSYSWSHFISTEHFYTHLYAMPAMFDVAKLMMKRYLCSSYTLKALKRSIMGESGGFRQLF